MTKVKITNQNGQQVNGYIDEKATNAQIKKEKLKEHLYMIYMIVGITAFSLAIISQIRRK